VGYKHGIASMQSSGILLLLRVELQVWKRERGRDPSGRQSLERNKRNLRRKRNNEWPCGTGLFILRDYQ